MSHATAERMILIWSGRVAVGVQEGAFVPNDTDGLSVTWLEYFGGDRQANMAGVRGAIGLTPRRSNRMAVLSVGNIERLATAIGASLVVVEDPYTDPPPGNPAHALVKEASALADEKLREALAATVQPADIEMY